MNNKIAVILIRGFVNLSPDVKKTLELLRLRRKHSCVVIDNTKENLGMAKKVKDYVTYGTIDEETYKKMLENRGEVIGKKKLLDVKVDPAKLSKEYFENKIKLNEFETKYKVKPYFRLNPPVGGFERGGIKKPFGLGGVLGDRKDKVKDLILKMI